MTAPRGRRSTARADQRRHILQHARRLYAEQGYLATTPEQVGEAAGVKMSSLRKLFPARIDLFRGLVRELLDSTLRAWLEQTADCPDPVTRLQRLAEMFLADTSSQGIAYRVMTSALMEGDGEVQMALREFAQEWEEQLSVLIAEGQQSGFFRRTLAPRVGAWQLMHTALSITLTQPLCIPLHEQADYTAGAIECALQCLLKTDI